MQKANTLTCQMEDKKLEAGKEGGGDLAWKEWTASGWGREDEREV